MTGSGSVTSATQDITGINVSTLSDGTLTYSVTLTDAAGNKGTAATATATLDTVAPSGYTITADQATVNTSQATRPAYLHRRHDGHDLQLHGHQQRRRHGSVTGSGSVTSATQNITGINVSSLSNGTLTYSVTLTDAAGNVGTAATATATLNTVAPSGYTITADQATINASQATRQALPLPAPRRARPTATRSPAAAAPAR